MGRFETDFLEEYTDEALLAECAPVFGSKFSCATDFVALPAAEVLQRIIELHADHIVSVADDGKTTLENLQTLCQDCNLGKGRTSIRWAARVGHAILV